MTIRYLKKHAALEGIVGVDDENGGHGMAFLDSQ